MGGCWKRARSSQRVSTIDETHGVSSGEDSGKDSDEEFIVDVLGREKTASAKNNTTGGGYDGCGASEHGVTEVLSAYEALRAKNVERNQKFVAELGLSGTKSTGNSKKRKTKGNNVKMWTQKRKVFALSAH